MKRMLFLMNPYAGQRKANRHLADIITIFNRAGYEVLVHMTSGMGDAARVAQEKAGEVDLIVCCGGDGTFNETVSGIHRSGMDTPVGYIPAGSTNDFAASLRLSLDPLQAARDIAEGSPASYDLGQFNDRYFSYVASFGAFTRVSYATPQSIKNALGHTAYLLSGIQEISQIHNEHVRLEIDGELVEDEFLFGAICNTTTVGGVPLLTPNLVDMSDGQFEVLLVRMPRNVTEITECIQAVQSQQYNCAMITFRSAREITVWPDPEMVWTLDGERADGSEQITIKNLHLAVKLMRRAEA
jgi:YegS/Rv2252/BmrU family lipid kinase